jgi:hypothetical protein
MVSTISDGVNNVLTMFYDTTLLVSFSVSYNGRLLILTRMCSCAPLSGQIVIELTYRACMP